MPNDTESSRSVLITGANGFVGSRLCRKFAQEGFRVLAGVRRTSDLSLLDELEVEFRYGDVTRPETLPDMVTGAEFIIHNAGVVKARHPKTFFTVNHTGTRSLFEAIAEHNRSVKKVIYISSLAAAGPSQHGQPLTEDDPPRPITAYGRSKLAGENIALSFANRINVLAVRPPGIYGPGDKEILSFFEVINRRIKPYIGNSERKLQLVHVDDLCHAVFLAVTNKTRPGETYFVAENRSYSLREMMTLLEQACGKKAYALHIPALLFRTIAGVSEFLFKVVGATPMLTREKAAELLASWEISTAKAQRDFGYKSQIPFEKGAAQTYKWYRREGWLK
ncbi:MAG: SDR family NAD(P)-dependent oxidoreductase [bacterium]